MSVRPVPPTSELTRPYWDAARRGEFVLQQCERCGHRPFPPRANCPECGSSELRWTRASGRGRVHSYTVAHRPPSAEFATQLPLVVAIVELEEGARIVTNLVDCDPSEIEIGAVVAVRFEEIDDTEMVLPVFTPVS